MRRLAPLLAAVLALGACTSDDSEPEPDEPSSTPAILLDPDPPAPDPATPVAGDHRLAVTLATGAEGEYLLHAPPAVEEGRPLPLVLVFHGSPGSPEEMVELTGFDAIADTEDLLVVYPDYFTQVEDVRTLIDHVAEVWPVDGRRIYAAGFSRGATTTYLLAEELSGRIAASAPVSGVQFGDFTPTGPTSLITFQGGRDQLASGFPEANRAWSRAAGCDPPDSTEVALGERAAVRSVADCDAGTQHVVYRIARMGHVWPRPATRLIWRFFEDHALVR